MELTHASRQLVNPQQSSAMHRQRGELSAGLVNSRIRSKLRYLFAAHPQVMGKTLKMAANAGVQTPAECHAARVCPVLSCMNWAQGLKLVFNIDKETCGRCGGSLKVIACIEDQDVIDSILAHLREREQDIPTLPLLTPPLRAPPETLPLLAGKEPSSTAFNQQGSH